MDKVNSSETMKLSKMPKFDYIIPNLKKFVNSSVTKW